MESRPEDFKITKNIQGVLRENHLVLWNSKISSKVNVFTERYFCLDLREEQIRWHDVSREENKRKHKFDPEVIRTSWNRKIPVTYRELPVPRGDTPVKLVYDRAFIPSTREQFWVFSPQQRREKETENWTKDYEFCVISSPTSDTKYSS
jgi:hypothetical protein